MCIWHYSCRKECNQITTLVVSLFVLKKVKGFVTWLRFQRTVPCQIKAYFQNGLQISCNNTLLDHHNCNL